MAEFQRVPQLLTCKGLHLLMPVDSMPLGKFPILRNVRAHRLGFIEARAGLAQINAAALDQLNVHSIRRLNDPSPGALPAWARAIGAGTKLYTGQAAFTERDSGYSGDPLSLIAFRPERSPQAWMYVADRLRMRKVRADGTDYEMGVAPPVSPPSAVLDMPRYATIADFDTVGGWANGGTAGALSAVARINTTITRIIYDAGATGWASIQPAAADEAIQPGVTMIVDSGGASQESLLVHQVHNAISATTIAAITYDSGMTGLCTIQLVNPTAPLRKNSVVLVGAGPTQEAVIVLSVTDGPDQSYSLRCSCANTHAATEAVVGLPTFRAYCGNTHAAAQTLTTNCVTTAVATGIGYLTLTIALDLSTIGARPTRNEDEMHISVRVDNPGNVVEGKVLLDCDSATNDFTQNYLFRAFRANDLTPATRDTLTVSTTRERALQREITDSATITYEEQQPGGGTLTRVVRVPPGGSVLEALLAAREAAPEYVESPEALPASEQAETGGVQWTELRFRLSDLTRVGTDSTRGLRNIAAIRVMLNVTAATQLSVDAWWIGGSYGPDCETEIGMFGAPLIYRYRYRSSQTGAKSLPSPATRSGLEPHRQRVVLTAALSADPQVDRIDFERMGGAMNQWRYLGTIDNAAPGVFNDELPDASIVGNAGLETDAYQPFPVVDLPKSGTCNVAGTDVTWVSGDAFSTSWAPGTAIKIAGLVYTLYGQPSSATRLQTVQNVGPKTAVRWVMEEPVLLAQPLPAMWGPLPNENFLFACGDDRNPGTLYATKGNDPDSAPDTHQIEVTNPSEPLMNGCIYDGKALVASTARWFWVRRSQGPNVLEHQEIPVGVGLYARWGIAVGPKVWFIGKDGIYETTGGEPTSITEDDIAALFPHEGSSGEAVNGFQPVDMTQSSALRLTYYDGWLYFDYLDTGGSRRTLAYDTTKRAWYPDTYTPPQLCHYGEEGEDVHALLCGGNDGHLYQASGTSDAGSAITCQVRTGSWNGGDFRSRKSFGDFSVSADPRGVNVTVQPGFDLFTVTPAANVVTAAIRTLFPLDLNAGLGQLGKDMALDFTWSSGGPSPRLYGWEPAAIAKPEDTNLRATDWIDLGAARWVQGCRLTADTGGVDRTVRIEYDGGALGATLTVNHNGELQVPYSWTPFVAHRLRLVPTDAASWRLLAFEPISEPMPELGLVWETQPTTHDLSGYQHERFALIAHMATADITLRVRVDGVDYFYGVGNNAGAYRKTRVSLGPVKGRSWAYRLNSTSAFRLFKRDCEIWVKAFGDPGPYRVQNPFGEVSRESGARI